MVNFYNIKTNNNSLIVTSKDEIQLGSNRALSFLSICKRQLENKEVKIDEGNRIQLKSAVDTVLKACQSKGFIYHIKSWIPGLAAFKIERTAHQVLGLLAQREEEEKQLEEAEQNKLLVERRKMLSNKSDLTQFFALKLFSNNLAPSSVRQNSRMYVENHQEGKRKYIVMNISQDGKKLEEVAARSRDYDNDRKTTWLNIVLEISLKHKDVIFARVITDEEIKRLNSLISRSSNDYYGSYVHFAVCLQGKDQEQILNNPQRYIDTLIAEN